MILGVLLLVVSGVMRAMLKPSATKTYRGVMKWSFIIGVAYVLAYLTFMYLYLSES